MALIQRAPATVDYRMKPPGFGALARGPHQCAPQFRSLWDGLAAAWPFYPGDPNDSDASVPDLLVDHPLSISEWSAVPCGYIQAPFGVAYQHERNASGDWCQVYNAYDQTPAGYPELTSNTDGGSILWYGWFMEFPTVGGGMRLFANEVYAANGAVRLRWLQSSDNFDIVGENSSGTEVFNAYMSNPYSAGDSGCVVGTYPPGSTGTVRIFLDGAEGTSDTMGALNATYNETYCSGFYSSTTGDSRIANYLAAAWNRELTVAEARLVSRFPWGPFWRWA